MEILITGLLATLQVAAVCFALFLFTRSISGFTRTEANRTATKFINTILILILISVVFYIYWPVLYGIAVFR
jgi:hypothetical protein